ncbi:MAG: tetratricopeptide repeat protein [Sphingomicrobium sp.]
MTGAKQRLIAAAAMALITTGCATAPKLAVKPLPTVLAQGRHPVSFRVAEAAGQFALGNVALALESYRKALREEPTSVDALTGMAVCYDAMGRFDVSRRHYEEALALAPSDSHLLGMFAASLLQQGRVDEAAAVRREAASRTAVSVSSVALQLAVPSVPSAALTSNASVVTVQWLNQAGSGVTLELPIAREIEQPAVPLPSPRMAPVSVAEPALGGPRLERLSLGEVALITAPQRSPQLAAAKPRSLVRAASDVPSLIRTASVVPSLVRTASVSLTPPLLLLNAARTQGLAARTRRYLATRGFAMALVGDAPRTRARTLIIAPKADRARALRLARTFSIMPQMVEGRRFTVVLGRDVLGPRALRA